MSFSCGSAVVVGKIRQLIQHFELSEDATGIYLFPEEVEALFATKKSKSGRTYYDLIDTDEEKAETTEEKVK